MPDGTRLTKRWYVIHYPSIPKARRDLEQQFRRRFRDWHVLIYRSEYGQRLPKDAMLTGICWIDNTPYSIYIYPGPNANPPPEVARKLPRAHYYPDDD